MQKLQIRTILLSKQLLRYKGERIMLEKLREIICEFVQMDPQSITEQTNIRSDLGLNSLELVNLAVAIEDAFDLEIPDRAVVGIETVADVMALLEEYSED